MILHWSHRDGGYEALGFCHFAPEWMQSYGETWAMCDPWFLAAKHPNRVNRLFLVHSAAPRTRFRQQPIYNDFLRDQGDGAFCCVWDTFSTPWDEGAIAAHRAAGAGPFEEADLADLST